MPTADELCGAIGWAMVAFALLAVLFVPLERAFAARAQAIIRPSLGLDLLYCIFQYTVMNFVLMAF
jgi:hypothetical protein